MKQIIISHTTALTAIRHYRAQENFWNYMDKINFRLLSNRHEQEKVEAKKLNRIDILVKSTNYCHGSSRIRFHMQPSNFNKNMILNFSDNVFCVSPELLICQMSRILSYEKLALLVHELCGTYTISDGVRFFEVDIKPITSVSKISKFVNAYERSNAHFKGKIALKEILNFAKDNSASPMESRTCIKLCGPHRKGFYACEGLELNKKINLSAEARILAGQNFVVPDICSETHKIAIEYDSAQFHENVEQGQRDKRRRDALIYDGWQTYTFVPATVNNPLAFNTAATSIMKGLKQDTRFITQNFKARQAASFKKLL